MKYQLPPTVKASVVSAIHENRRSTQDKGVKNGFIPILKKGALHTNFKILLTLSYMCMHIYDDDAM
jgi:hypothetical protein